MTNEDARVELVVKIDENTYKDIKKGKVYTAYYDVPLEAVLAIANGIPLHKGHGRLIDGDKLEKEIYVIDSYSEEPVRQQISDAHTIIEADKDGEE